MHGKIPTLGAMVLSGLLLGGCGGGNVYHPAGNDMDHAVYAGKAKYPDMQAEPAAHVFAKVSPDATITIDNAGDEPYSDFELWVNRAYTLHVLKLDARSEIVISPADVYNSTAGNLVSMPASSINSVQIYEPSAKKLIDVQGPILPH